SVAVTAADAHRAVDAVWRIESPKLIAGLTRIVRDVGLAEELAQDALVAAVEQWPESGVPDNPGAWLMATAKHRAIDRLRRDARLERKREEIGRELGAAQKMATAVPERGGDFGDDLLRLVFIACHPVLSTEARVALTLRLAGGPWPRCHHGDPSVAHEGARGTCRRAHPPSRSKPRAVGPAPDPSRARRARTRRGARRRARAIRAAGGDRGLPCASAHGRGNGLGPDRGALRRARAARTLT